MKIVVLGSGTSTGVPVPGCSCRICTSSDPKDNRLRTSVLVQIPQPSTRPFNLIIDTSTDLRYQSLRAGLSRIDAVLYTHAHADHIFGMDDLRGFNFVARGQIPVFADQRTAEHLTRIFAYVFDPEPGYLGGGVPQISLHVISAGSSFALGPVEVQPLTVLHGRLPVLGYRIGNFAYLTDCSSIPEESYQFLQGLDVLIIDGLRLTAHPTHFNYEGAVREVERINPKKSYLTHISHETTHTEGNKLLAEMTPLDVELAYDGLTFEVAERSK